MKGAEILFLRNEQGFVSRLTFCEDGIRYLLQENDGTKTETSMFGRLISTMKGWLAPEMRLSSRFSGHIWQHELTLHDMFHFVFLDGTTAFQEWLLGCKALTMYGGAKSGGAKRRLRDSRLNRIEDMYPSSLQRDQNVVDFGTILSRDFVIGEEDGYVGNRCTGFSKKMAEIVERHLASGVLADYSTIVGSLNLQLREHGMMPLEALSDYDADFCFVGGVCLLPETVAAIEAMNAEIAREEQNLKACFWGQWLARFMVPHSTHERFYPTKGMRFANMIEVLRAALVSLQETYWYKTPRFVPYPDSEMMKDKR